MIDSGMWSNENVAALPPRGRLLLIGMINNADDQGRIKAHPVYLTKEIFPYDHVEVADITKWLAHLQDNGTIQVYMVEGKQYAQFINWWKYQTLSFAIPSAYPPPPEWRDRFQFNGKRNRFMSYNWRKADGSAIPDTCDQHGNPLLQAPTQDPSQEGTQAPSQDPSLEGTQDPSQVNKEYIEDQDQEEKEGDSAQAAPRCYAAPPPTHDVPAEAALKPGQHLYRAVCEILGWDYKTLSTKSQVQVAEAVKKFMAAGYVTEELERFMGEVWAKDWRWKKKKQRPTLAELQAEVGKLRASSLSGKGNYSGAYQRAEADDAARRQQYTAYNDLLPKAPKQAQP